MATFIIQFYRLHLTWYKNRTNNFNDGRFWSYRYRGVGVDRKVWGASQAIKKCIDGQVIGNGLECRGCKLRESVGQAFKTDKQKHVIWLQTFLLTSWLLKILASMVKMYIFLHLCPGSSAPDIDVKPPYEPHMTTPQLFI
jgi:hypothetical protein